MGAESSEGGSAVRWDKGCGARQRGPGQSCPQLMGPAPAVSSQDVSLRCSRNNIPRARLRMLKMSLVIVSSFILCWTPYYLLGLWHWFCPRAMERIVSPALAHILFIFGLLNACLDPVTYGLFTIRFRRRWGCPCGQDAEPQPPSPATGSFRCSASSLPPKRGVPRLPPGTASCQSSSL